MQRPAVSVNPNPVNKIQTFFQIAPQDGGFRGVMLGLGREDGRAQGADRQRAQFRPREVRDPDGADPVLGAMDSGVRIDHGRV